MSLDGCVRRSDEFTFICSSLLCVCMTKLRTMAKLWAWWEGKTVSLFGSLDACVNHILCFASTLVRLSDFECRKSCFFGRCQSFNWKKIVNSLSPSSPSASSSLRAIYDVIMHFIPGEIPSPTAGTELIKFCFSFFSFFNLHRQKRNRMEIYPVVRAKIPTPTRPLTPTMIRRDWGSKGSCNAIVLRSPMIKSTAWRKSLSGLTIQSKRCDDFFLVSWRFLNVSYSASLPENVWRLRLDYRRRGFKFGSLIEGNK